MKFALFALLASSTQAAVALVAEKDCIDAPTLTAVKAFWADIGKATPAQWKAAEDARLACKTDALPTSEESKRGMINWYLDLATYAPQGSSLRLLKPALTAAENTSMKTALDLYGEALGMGKAGCLYNNGGCTGLKGTYAQRGVAFRYAMDYFLAVKANCSKDLKDKTRCSTKFDADVKVLKEIGAEFAKEDYISKKTAAEQTTWLAAYDKKRLAAASPPPAAGAVGFVCKAAAVVAPATVGVRPACGTENCCMGVRKTAEDKTNASETCQLKTATKAKHETTPAGFTVKSGYIYQTTLQVEAADYVAACIEGAVRNTSAALSVLAAAYMMA